MIAHILIFPHIQFSEPQIFFSKEEFNQIF
jgi:hypothetical protein